MIFPILHYTEIGPAIFEENQLQIYWGVILLWITKAVVPVGLSTLLVIAFLAVLARQVFHILRQKYLAKIQSQFWGDMRYSAISAFMKSDLSYLSTERPIHTLWRGHTFWDLSVVGGKSDVIPTTRSSAYFMNKTAESIGEPYLA